MLLASGGDFSQLEIKVKRLQQKESIDEISGGYVNEIYLKNVKFWDDDMIQCSKQWAIARGLKRTSAIHGKDEWKIPLDESFLFRNTNLESATASSSAHVEVITSACPMLLLFS